MPRDILDSPCKLPGELDPPKRNDDPPADPYADDTKEERAARLAWPEFPWTPGEYVYDRDHRAVMVPRTWFATRAAPDAVTYSVLGGVVYACITGRPQLCCSDPGPMFDGVYLPSRSLSLPRGS